MKKSLAAAMAAVIVVVAGPAWAAGPPYTVSVGGSSAPTTHPISLSTGGFVKMSIKNSFGTIINANCGSIAMNGGAVSGPSVNPWAVVASSTWTGCFIPGGAATVTHTGTWAVLGSGTNASTGTDVVAGYLVSVNFTSKVTANPAACTLTVQGAGGSGGVARGRFDEGAQQLLISETGYTHNLEVSSVTGCLGQIQVGNPVDLEASLHVSSPDGPIDLS